MNHRQDADGTRPRGQDARATSRTSSQMFLLCVAPCVPCSTSFGQRPRSRDRLPDNKKTVVPARGTTAIVHSSPPALSEGYGRHHTCVPRRENTTGPQTQNFGSGTQQAQRPQAGFLTRILPRGSFPFAGGRTVDYASRISEEQMLTAARPSRILTAFPFRYPKARALRPAAESCTLQRAYTRMLRRGLSGVKWKNLSFARNTRRDSPNLQFHRELQLRAFFNFGWPRQASACRWFCACEGPSARSEDFACRCHPDKSRQNPPPLVGCRPAGLPPQFPLCVGRKSDRCSIHEQQL
jgi:hypothetical protein